MWRGKVERGTEGWQGQGQCQQRQQRHEGPGLETKIIKPRSGSFRKPLKNSHQGDINRGPCRMEKKKKKKRRELSVCLFGLRPLRNNYSLLITIWRKETQSPLFLCVSPPHTHKRKTERAREGGRKQHRDRARRRTGKGSSCAVLPLHSFLLGWSFPSGGERDCKLSKRTVRKQEAPSSSRESEMKSI